VKGEVWEKRIQKRLKRMKKGLDRVSIVRDVRFVRLPGLRPLVIDEKAFSWTVLGFFLIALVC
jgi:hypothetical protein